MEGMTYKEIMELSEQRGETIFYYYVPGTAIKRLGYNYKQTQIMSDYENSEAALKRVRFLNYWHAYACSLLAQAKKGEETTSSP